MKALICQKYADMKTKLYALRSAARRAAKVFRTYERLHRAKGTVEGLDKANQNANEAERLEALL